MELRPIADQPPPLEGPVFSIEDGQVWLSLGEQVRVMALGRVDDVAEMMQDFLQQVEFGRALLNKAEKLGA